MFPYITRSVAAIRKNVSASLPLFLFQTRESPPENMAVAVPFKYGASPYNSRVLPTNLLTPEQILLLGDFAQALWFLIDTGTLPRPEDGDKLERALLKMTGPAQAYLRL